MFAIRNKNEKDVQLMGQHCSIYLLMVNFEFKVPAILVFYNFFIILPCLNVSTVYESRCIND
jgi:hypothetical protein